MCEEGIVYIQKKPGPSESVKSSEKFGKRKLMIRIIVFVAYTWPIIVCASFITFFFVSIRRSVLNRTYIKLFFSRLREHRNRQKWNLRINFHSGSYCIDFHDIWWLLKEPFVSGGKPTEWVYLLLVYLVTALVPSLTACLASSPGRSSLMAVWISRELMVDFLL